MTITINKPVTDKTLMPAIVLFFISDSMPKITDKRNRNINTGKYANIPIEKKRLMFKKGMIIATIRKSRDSLREVVYFMKSYESKEKQEGVSKVNFAILLL